MPEADSGGSVKPNGRKPIWRSRKFWYALVAALIPIINKLAKLELDTATVWQAMSPLLGGLGVEGAIDVARGVGEAKNGK